MTLLRTLLPCIAARKPARPCAPAYPNEKSEGLNIPTPPPIIRKTKIERATDHYLDILLTADKRGKVLSDRLEGEVGVTGWSDKIAERLLAGLEDVVREGKDVGGAVGDALTHARKFAADFAHEHPVYKAVIVTVIALGVLYLLWPWVISVLGFGELGPVEGSWAAWWQAAYGGNVPAGSLFSALQRLGMLAGK